ncbi:hypothetical protein TMatcc_002869 [Talaromyces marneffei ATCC 18224]|uniref:ORC6 first cyclin-like domain-containing protein n=1 Tax=Talaromyces marneffei (strain ATCC 18224 / CBS 334.59 / QM 7333) TaxID=441960 RepID=B6Q7P5_TALMQ|nr:uncharacterized protein EYB26_002047 [Talaromyces marneffei]EEA28780.1 conserved hypothetical protein [Talaromyces marneffei ATCC 18224]KAE8555608.1 hypothetical protein EYB25_000306 [Talaromyces marneffei]QGA14394.1 hypothetical protein EYB26_002047 [Talaromyces marneffei]
MNNLRPVERALATLLPTHENEMPPELLSLAQSFFAQSRSYSSSLKPEEEIARPHACAEIACRRLARTLKLPPLLGHPPCPPRVYKKLYTFLEKSIGNATSKNKSAPPTPNKPSSTPKKNDTATSRTPSKQLNTPSKSTPLEKRALHNEANKTPSRMTSVKRAHFTKEPLQLLENIKDAPQFVMPSIRTICKMLSTPAPRMTLWSRPPISRTLPPHIFAGVSSILHFISKMTDKEVDELDEDASEFVNIIRNPEEEGSDDYKEVIMALIVAIYFLVLARRRSPPLSTTPANGKQPTVSDNPPMSPAAEPRKMDKKTFSEMRQTALSSLGLPPAEKRHGEDVDAWIEIIQTLKWAKGQEWFDNIPLAGEREDELGNGLYDDDDEVDGDGQDGRKAQGVKRRKTNIFLHAGKDEEGLLLPGLGTMMQDRVDYLSEDRREDYVEWKADMLERICKIMKTGKRMAV